jgi:hypothetical protein
MSDYTYYDDENDDNINNINNISNEIYAWNDDNQSTLSKWIIECEKRLYVYRKVLDICQNHNNRMTLISKVFGYMLSLTNSLQTVLDPTTTFSFILRIVNVILSISNSCIIEYQKNEQHNNNIKSYADYIKDTDTFLSRIKSIDSIKNLELRPNGDEFILSNRELYENIQRNAPHLTRNQWRTHVKEFVKHRKVSRSIHDANSDDYYMNLIP